MKKYIEFITEDTDVDYYDFESVIQWFWMCSFYNKWDNFDFKKAFETFEDPIYRKLAEHAQLDYQDFLEMEKEMIEMLDVDLSSLEIHTDYLDFSEEDILDGIFTKKYEICENAFSGLEEFIILSDMYKDIQNHRKLDLPQKIALFDSVIHAKHVSGDIFGDYVDVGKLRAEFDKDMRKMKRR